MTLNLDSQIEEARDLFEKAFKLNRISKRNKFLTEGLEKFKDLEEKEINEKQKQKISNIKNAYSRELLKDLKPTESIDNDLTTSIILFRLNSDLDEIFRKYPDLEVNYNEFNESMRRDPAFHRFINRISKKYEK